MAAQEEIYKREEEITQLKDLLSRVIKERDEANDRYQKLLFLHQQRQQQQQQQQQVQHAPPPPPGPSQEDDGRSEESIVCGSPVQSMETIGPLPEKGKLLQAVMKAGPLLQTLLLAGPLPQWRHPPPPLEAVEIPPVAISVETNIDPSPSSTGRKRSLVEEASSYPPTPPPLLRRPSDGFFKMTPHATLIN